KQLLLILDNCEHLLEACAQLVDELLRSSGSLTVLTTSREAMGIGGERIHRVPPLTVPSGGTTDVSEISRSQAIRLFVERAGSMDAGFTLNRENAPTLAEVCRRLDGIPLAIELAASRVKLLSIPEIARRLDDRFRLLTGGSRTALPRQQTLRALIDWSYDLLTETERTMLRRLSVFMCAWTLEGAERVCGGAGVDSVEVLDLVSALVDKSLVAVEGGEGETRYRLLESIRQYARDKLLDQGEAKQVRDLHLEYFVELVEEADSKLRGAQQRDWLNLLDRHGDEFRAALGWASTNEQSSKCRRLAVGLWRYWRVRSNFSEGRRWLDEALHLRGGDDGTDPAEAERLRSRCLISAGSLANYQGDYLRADKLLSESLALCRELNDLPGIANSLSILAHSRVMTGDREEAGQMLAESLEIFTRLGRKRGIAYANYCLGSLMVRKGDYAAAREHLSTGLVLMEELEDAWWIENILLELGWAAGRSGDFAAALGVLHRAQELAASFNDRRGKARALMHIAGVCSSSGDEAEAGLRYRESLDLFAEIGDKWGVVSCIEGIAAARLKLGESGEAIRLLGAAGGLRGKMKSNVHAIENEDHLRLIEQARESVGETGFARAFEEGRSLSYLEAIARAREV
ncbi:MAG TPA: tetratricopeptide repeat protein, partial [Spirochaetia bacterium]|nr:tetratricopeptide repeat protein [Spirochaetia bacterium]